MYAAEKSTDCRFFDTRQGDKLLRVMSDQVVRRSGVSLAAIARHPLVWVAVIGLGVLLRVLAAFPPFRSAVQSDSTMTGLTAFEILRGDLQVFLFNGTRLGALESYLHVPVFALFGASRGTLHVAPQFAGIALLVAFAVLARDLLGPEEGLVALLFLSLPSPVVLLWNVWPIGYTETLLFITVTLACAVRIARRGPEPLPVFGLGLAVGLGWWGSALSLAGTLPAVFWIVLQRPAVWRRGRSVALAAAGFLLGALPWIAINIRHPLVSFRPGLPASQGNFAFHTADGLQQLAGNFVRLGDRLIGLLLRADAPRSEVLTPVVVLAGAIYCAALIVAVLQVAAPGSWTGMEENGARRVPPLLLPLLVGGCTGAFFVLSAAGGIIGETSRYILPVGLAAALLLASLAGRIAARSRAASALAVLAVLAANLSGYALPGTAPRSEQRRLARAEDRLLDLLAERRIAWVFGDYWDVYSLNYLSGETIKAIPEVPFVDYHGYKRSLACAPSPMAVISRDPVQVKAWVRRGGLRGETVSVDGAFTVFFPNPNPPRLWAPDVEVRLRGFRRARNRCGEGAPTARTSPSASRAAPG